MNTLFLGLASAASLLTFVAHVFIGGPRNAQPIFSLTDLPNGPKTTMFFSWNAASLLLLSISLGFAYAALSPAATGLSLFLTLLCGAHALLGFGVAAHKGETPWAFPPAILFSAITVFGSLALITQ